MNHIDTLFEDQVREMLSDRAADIPDRPRRDVLPITTVRPEMPAGRSRRRVHIAVAAATVFAGLTAGLVLRPDDSSDVSMVPADSPDQPIGLPSTFDIATAPVIFWASGDADEVVGAYLRARFPDYPSPGVAAGRATIDGTEAVATWSIVGENSTPYGGAIVLRSDDGAWGVVAATTDGVNLTDLAYDGQRVHGRVIYSGIDLLAVDVTDLVGEPAEGAPRPNGYPGAEYRFGTAGDSDTGSLNLNIAAIDETVIVRAQYVGGTLLSIAEIALMAPPMDPPSPGSGFAVWPNEATATDRSSAPSAARSFATEVIGRTPTAVTADPEAAPDGPTWVDLELDTASVRLLAVPTKDGWVVLQVGDGGPTVSADPPTAHAAPVASATDIEVRIDTTGGVNTVYVPVDQLADGVPIDSDLDGIRSIIAIYRDSSGAVLAVHGGHYG